MPFTIILSFFLLTQRSAYYTTVFMRCPLGLFGQLLLLDPLCPSLEGAAQMSRCNGQMRYRGGTIGNYWNLSKYEQVRTQRIEILCESHERDYCVILKLFAFFFLCYARRKRWLSSELPVIGSPLHFLATPQPY